MVFAESFRAFFGESSQIEEEWRERFSAQGLWSSASRDRYSSLINRIVLDVLHSDVAPHFDLIYFGARLFRVYL